VVVLAHNHAFHPKPGFVPEAAVAVIDEAFWPAAMQGTDELHPLQLAVSALLDERTGRVTGMDRDRLLWLRRRAAEAPERQDEGGLLREGSLHESQCCVRQVRTDRDRPTTPPAAMPWP
jgi:hypothetical protein